jgi:mycothiol synthase
MTIMARFFSKVKYILSGKSRKGTTASDLEMILPNEYVVDKKYELHNEYLIRQYNEIDYIQFMNLINSSDLSGCSLDYWNKQVLPDGFFIIEHKASGNIVGACLAAHHPNARHPLAGCLGWLAVNPEHRGKKIGEFLTFCVMERLIKSGYKRIFLGTQDHRLAAIKTYLKLGWVPYYYEDGMKDRWESVLTALDYGHHPLIPQENS